MLTQLLAWTATIVGLASTWLVGRRHRAGWIAGIACCLLWVAVNARIHIWAGIASALVAAALSARNWIAWRHAPSGGGSSVTSPDTSDHGNITTPDAADLNAAARRYAASQGWALPDGSYPIRPANMHGLRDLAKAILAIGRASNPMTVKRHIIKRARALNAVSTLPKSWNVAS